MKNIYSQRAMKSRHIIRKLVVLLVLVAFSGNSVVFAAEKLLSSELESRREVLKEALPGADLVGCDVLLKELYDIETMEFLGFLDVHFKNKSSTSSLTNTAIARYLQYKKTISDHFDQFSPDVSTVKDVRAYDLALTSYEACSALTDSYVRLAKEQMIRHIKNNNVQKKTTVMLEKFKSVNEKLRDLNSAIAELYSFFATFKNKLPGFLRKCV